MSDNNETKPTRNTNHLEVFKFEGTHKKTVIHHHNYHISPDDFINHHLEPTELAKWDAMTEEEQTEIWDDFKNHCRFQFDEENETDCLDEEWDEYCDAEINARDDDDLGQDICDDLNDYIETLKKTVWMTDEEREKEKKVKAAKDKLEECKRLTETNKRLQEQIRKNEILTIQAETNALRVVMDLPDNKEMTFAEAEAAWEESRRAEKEADAAWAAGVAWEKSRAEKEAEVKNE
jgi:hypothetical protein